jgi:pyrroline-5-carboxylate reductase
VTQTRETLGIIGVGHLAEALVAGLMATDNPPSIVLSPHNPDRARRIATRFGLTVARDNAEVVGQSRIVLVATRPEQVLGAICDLPWRADQTAISVAAGVALPNLGRAVRPATAVRALPVTAVEIGESPTCIIPEIAAARALFEPLGTVHAFDDEAAFDLATIHGVVYSAFHAVIRSTVEWFVSSGLPRPEARRLCALTIRAAAGMILAQPQIGLDAMVHDFARPGSLTLLALGQLRDTRALEGMRSAWSAALERSREIGATTSK